jgi:hypothetical protein
MILSKQRSPSIKKKTTFTLRNVSCMTTPDQVDDADQTRAKRRFSKQFEPTAFPVEDMRET